ncbi:hypothetical protein QZH41_017931, partial [Actinostola sp. cb2023]
MENLLIQQQQHTLALMLPQPEIPTFAGDPIEYCIFIRAFESLIESRNDGSSARLYYLVQYTSVDVHELMRSCLSMNHTEGYHEVRRLLKERYGQDYKIATAYVDRVTMGPPIRAEKAEDLRKFSILITSCKNVLRDIGYLNRINNPDCLKKIVDRLPFDMKQIPLDQALEKEWIKWIKRDKGAKFTITKTVRPQVCLKHFKPSDLRTTITGRRVLVENAIPRTSYEIPDGRPEDVAMVVDAENLDEADWIEGETDCVPTPTLNGHDYLYSGPEKRCLKRCL